MDDSTAERLVTINQTFYDRFWAAFDETRSRPWPGWRRLRPATSPDRPIRILDLGCGNGRFAAFWAQAGEPFAYEGWDACAPLLARAQRGASGRFRRVDLLADPWPDHRADLVCAFGLFHHIPGEATRRRLLARALQRVESNGRLAVCFWQFAPGGTPRIATAPWAEADVDPRDVEPGDYLVRWRRGGDGLRYCHHVDDAELSRLLEGLPGSVEDDFVSDGASGDANRYVVLRPAK